MKVTLVIKAILVSLAAVGTIVRQTFDLIHWNKRRMRKLITDDQQDQEK